jgi:hypothetical protein
MTSSRIAIVSTKLNIKFIFKNGQNSLKLLGLNYRGKMRGFFFSFTRLKYEFVNFTGAKSTFYPLKVICTWEFETIHLMNHVDSKFLSPFEIIEKHLFGNRHIKIIHPEKP